METPSVDTIVAAAELLAIEGLSEDDMEARMRVLAPDDVTATRLLNVIPEAFGLVLIAHLVPPDTMTLPTTFRARNAAGDWQDIGMTREPIFAAAIDLARHVFRNGPRRLFRNVSERSALTAIVNKALNAGRSVQVLEGSTLHGPEFFGIRSEIYS